MWLKIIGLVIIALVSINPAYAEILMSQPSLVYNLGDNLDVSSIISSSENAPLKLNLKCNEAEVNLLNTPDKKINISIPVSESYFKNLEFISGSFSSLRGNCSIIARFLEQKEEKSFVISDKISVSLSLQNLSVEAGKEIKIEGKARKENGKEAEGFVEMSIKDINVKSEVKNGSFSSSITLPENTKSGSYILGARVYEKAGEKETNKGNAGTSIFIKQTPKRIGIGIKSLSVVPGNSAIFLLYIYDQADDLINGSVDIKIYNAEEKVFAEKMIETGKEESVFIATNNTAGYWKMQASAFNIEERKLFFVEELEKVEFSIDGNVLTVTNIGNVPYKKAIEVKIGEYVETKNVQLERDESIKFELNAKDGNYEIVVSDGNEKKTASSYLTGKAIGVNEIKKSIFPKNVIWVFVILALGIFIVIAGKKIIKKKIYAYPTEGERRIKTDKNFLEEKLGFVPVEKETGDAEHSLVLEGRKENSSVAVVNIKNLEQVKNEDVINRIKSLVKENKGAMYISGNFITAIFSSPTTRTFKNEMLAVNSAIKINEMLKEHNLKFKNKIEYGIGLNSGELIVKKEDKLRFTPIGNTISLARKISSLASNDLLLSSEINKKVMNEVKAEKNVKEGIEAYSIKRISDREEHSKFIQGFLERNK